MNEQLTALADELERDQQTLQRELDEIDLLLRQGERVGAPRGAPRAGGGTSRRSLSGTARRPASGHEARAQLLIQTRRATLMQAQLEVLEGKQTRLRALPRELGHDTADWCVAGGALASRPTRGGTAARRPTQATSSRHRKRCAARSRARCTTDRPRASPTSRCRRRSCERLFERDPAQPTHELHELVAMVQHALEATKTFIFDVRPMVLDDLGLVPTLRRSAAERSRRRAGPCASNRSARTGA